MSRRALADYLGRARGVLTSPDLIVVCSGYVHGLALLCQALRARGAATIAHEDPSLPAARRAPPSISPEDPSPPAYRAIMTRAALRPRGGAAGCATAAAPTGLA